MTVLSVDLDYRLTDIALSLDDGYVLKSDMTECFSDATPERILDFLATEVARASDGRLSVQRADLALFKVPPAPEAIPILVTSTHPGEPPRLLTLSPAKPGLRQVEMVSPPAPPPLSRS